MTVSVGLNGSLRDFGIADVFQLIGQQRKTGVLEIERRDCRVALHFDGGSVVSAAPVRGHADTALADMLVRCGLLTREQLDRLSRERESSLQSLRRLVVEQRLLRSQEVEAIEDLLTHETLFDVLRWTRGSFRFTAQPVPHDRDPATLLPAEQILMDGLRMADEWRTFAADVPSDDTIFQRSAPFDGHRESARGEARRRLATAERIHDLVDGRLTARRVIDLSRLGTFEATRLLSDLRRSGVIEPVDPRRVAPRRRDRAAPGVTPVGVRSWIAAALPLAILAALAVSVLAGGPPDPRAGAPESLAVQRSPLRAARALHATERVRAALDAWRFSEGRRPARLGELVAEGYLEPGALADPEARPYYSSRRDGGMILLAPEH